MAAVKKNPTNADVLAEIKIVQKGQNDLVAIVSRQGQDITALQLWQAEKKGEEKQKLEHAQLVRDEAQTGSNLKALDWKTIGAIAVLVLGIIYAVVTLATKGTISGN